MLRSKNMLFEADKVMFEIYRETEYTGKYRVCYFTELQDHNKESEINHALAGEHFFDGFIKNFRKDEAKEIIASLLGRLNNGEQRGCPGSRARARRPHGLGRCLRITRYPNISEPQFFGCVSAFVDSLSGELNAATMSLRRLAGSRKGSAFAYEMTLDTHRYGALIVLDRWSTLVARVRTAPGDWTASGHHRARGGAGARRGRDPGPRQHAGGCRAGLQRGCGGGVRDGVPERWTASSRKSARRRSNRANSARCCRKSTKTRAASFWKIWPRGRSGPEAASLAEERHPD